MLTFTIMGDGKVLATVAYNEDSYCLACAFAEARAYAKQTEGATSIRHGMGTYNI